MSENLTLKVNRKEAVMSENLTLKVVSEDRESWYYFPGIQGEIKCSEGAGDYVLREIGSSGSDYGKIKVELEVIDVSELSCQYKFDKEVIDEKIKQYSYDDRPRIASCIRTNSSNPPRTTIIFDPNLVFSHHDIFRTNWIEYIDSNDIKRLIVFNTPAFLLNEFGQTIDKFNEVRTH